MGIKQCNHTYRAENRNPIINAGQENTRIINTVRKSKMKSEIHDINKTSNHKYKKGTGWKHISNHKHGTGIKQCNHKYWTDITNPIRNEGNNNKSNHKYRTEINDPIINTERKSKDPT